MVQKEAETSEYVGGKHNVDQNINITLLFNFSFSFLNNLYPVNSLVSHI